MFGSLHSLRSFAKFLLAQIAPFILPLPGISGHRNCCRIQLLFQVHGLCDVPALKMTRNSLWLNVLSFAFTRWNRSVRFELDGKVEVIDKRGISPTLRKIKFI